MSYWFGRIADAVTVEVAFAFFALLSGIVVLYSIFARQPLFFEIERDPFGVTLRFQPPDEED